MNTGLYLLAYLVGVVAAYFVGKAVGWREAYRFVATFTDKSPLP